MVSGGDGGKIELLFQVWECASNLLLVYDFKITLSIPAVIFIRIPV